MNNKESTTNLRVMAVLAASLWTASLSVCGAQAVCVNDADCAKGFTCKLKAPPPCPAGTRCDYVVTGQCEPATCEHDSDCAEGSICGPKGVGISCPKHPIPCLPNGVCPRVGVTCTHRTCKPASESEATACETDSAVAELHASDYDQHCESDADCVFVPDGNVCMPCVLACSTGTVNKQAQAQYLEDLRSLTDTSPDDVVCACPAKSVAPSCIAGVCSSAPHCN